MDKVTQFQESFRFLSNFWISPLPVFYNGVQYKSVEHAYQALKCVDKVDHDSVMMQSTPSIAKNLVKHMKQRPDWAKVKLTIMLELVRSKFFGNAYLGQKLKDTGDAELVEGNMWYDTYWGVDLRSGKGDNHLGKILMQVRKELNDDDSNTYTKA